MLFKFIWFLRASALRLLYRDLCMLYIGKPIFWDGLTRFKLGHGVGIFPGSRIEVLKNSRLTIGDNTKIGHNFFVDASAPVTIGKNCVISANVFIGTQDYNWRMVGKQGFKQSATLKKEVIIGENVFVGLNSVILPGANIPNGTVIKANSIIKN
jgi:acetyltransferase-like isoleucine patch superfamily enzyme